MGGNWCRVIMLVGLASLLCPGSAGAAEKTFDTFTSSTSHHRYDVYVGTVDLLRPGAASPYLSKAIFESEIRFDQQAVEQVGAALTPDSRFASGITTTSAPDGGSWVTAGPRPGWWEKPNGSVQDQALFDAEGRFAAAAQSLLVLGETASCTESDAGVTVLQENETAPSDSLPYAVQTTKTFGPGTVGTGKDKSEEHVVVGGETNYNTDTSFLVLTVHRLNRTCVVSPPTNTPVPKVTPDRCATAPDTDKDGIADACDEDPSIPDSCALRVARSRVFVYKSKPKARLVVKYKTRSPAQVKTTYTATLANGKKMALGSLKKKFAASGTFKLPVALAEDAANKVRTAKSFTVSFSIPGAPKSCAAAYTKQLTKKATVGKQSVWFQSDSVLGGLF